MKKFVLLLALLLGTVFIYPSQGFAYNFGDFRSTTLVGKAWEALGQKDLEAVLAYTNKCIELYASEAKKMQASLTDYPEGDKDKIFAYWALNDVSTALFIQAEAYRNANMMAEARAAYQKLIDEFSFGKCWDPNGWFWKPAEAAKAKIEMIDTGSTVDYGDYKSSTLTAKAWQALNDKDIDAVVSYVNKCLELYGEQAKEMQASLTALPVESKEKIFSYWALNDVGTCLYIKGEAFRQAGILEVAQKAYQTLVDEYYYAQCWDTNGWFWEPAKAAQEKLDEIAAQGPVQTSSAQN
ncbi:MAG: tetratricopeptide repeat protein [Candidatus Omnitrophica bacterium]|nr:tetratricopeptide repeat protein [Candidatus Omnitrophota bacterium]